MNSARYEILRFAVAGVAGFLVDAGVLYLCLGEGLGYFAGRVVSFLCAVFCTWRINRRFTFAASPAEGSLWAEWWRYLIAMSAGGAVNYAAYSVSVLTLKGILLLPLLSVAIGSIVGLTVNFIGAKLWVFKQR
ncbi:GtrA family protein [Paraburkholderia xenovorans]|uniref:GtrA family protein n=1 Tax=Paraburkholderia xenovorans TaxID=36873 RepID=UPI0038BCD21A